MSQYFIKLTNGDGTLLSYYGETHPKEGDWVKFGAMNYQVNAVTHVVTNKSGGNVHPDSWLVQVECSVGRFYEEE